MKMEEFKREVLKLGFSVEGSERKDHLEFVAVDEGCRYKPFLLKVDGYGELYINHEKLRKYPLSIKSILIRLGFALAMTPIEERASKPCYYLKDTSKGHEYNPFNFLRYNQEKNNFFIGGRDEDYPIKTRFTQEEIDQLPNQDFVKKLLKQDANKTRLKRERTRPIM